MAKLLPTQVIIAAFNDEELADQVALGLGKAVKDKQIPPFRNMATVQKDETAKIKISELGNAAAFAGGGVGAVVGGLSCILLGPAGVAAGATAGALIGHAGTKALVEGSIDKERVQQFGNMLPPKASGIIVVFEEVAIEKTVWKDVAVQQFRDEMIHQVSTNMGDTLRQGQNVAYLLSVTDEGITSARMAVGEDAADIQGVVLSAEGVVAGQAEATEDAIVYEVAGGGASNDSIEAAYKAGVITEDGKATLEAAAAADVVDENQPQ